MARIITECIIHIKIFATKNHNHGFLIVSLFSFEVHPLSSVLWCLKFSLPWTWPWYLGSTLIFFRVIVTVNPRCNEGARDRKYVRYTEVSLYRGSFSNISLAITGVKNIVPYTEDVVYEEVPLYINLLFMSKSFAHMDMARVSWLHISASLKWILCIINV